MSGSGKYTRRGFIKGTASAALTTALGLPACRTAVARRDARGGGAAPPEPAATPAATAAGEDRTEERPGPRSTVVLVRDANAVDAGGNVNAGVVERMLDDAVLALTGAGYPVEAWRTLVPADAVVGIKSNVWDYLPTPPAVENAILRRLAEAGVPPGSVRVDDRGARRTLADCTALVNVRPLRTHHWSGIGGCIKNYIVFVERPEAYHHDACADLGAIWKLPIARGKTRLNILLALTPLFWGRGPHHFDPRYVWPYGGIFVSFDPVAADSLGARLVRARRIAHFGEDRAITSTRHVDLADTRHRLGVADPSRIDVVRLGRMDGALV